MARVGFGRSGSVAAVVLVIQVAATQAEAAVIYDYRGTEFTICGTGCQENGPPNWDEDYLIASLTFEAPLAPNLTFDDEVRTGLLQYTATDKLGTFVETGTTLPDVDDDGEIFPGLKLATDANGNITSWIMWVAEANHAVTANPPLVCPPEECSEALSIANYIGVTTGPGFWDAVSETPGTWSLRTQVPEPATLALSLIVLGRFAVRQRRQFLARR